jgi:GTP-binding protein Era
MNCLLGEKISIISSKPQTTRNTIQTVLTRDNYQIVFLDTPGIHKPKHKLGEYMVRLAQDTLDEVDVVLFLITPEKQMGNGDKYIIEQIKNVKSKVVLVINKIDEVTKEDIAKCIDIYSKEVNFDAIVPISALKKINIDELLKVVVGILPEGPKYFPDDTITDQPERFIVGEIIREKALNLLEQEVPHGIAVEINQMKDSESGRLMTIDANIYCEKDSHKAIIIGKNGQMLKKIGMLSRQDMEKLLGTKVFLQLWVKVKKDWRDNAFLLKGFGYK